MRITRTAKTVKITMNITEFESMRACIDYTAEGSAYSQGDTYADAETLLNSLNDAIESWNDKSNGDVKS